MLWLAFSMVTLPLLIIANLQCSEESREAKMKKAVHSGQPFSEMSALGTNIISIINLKIIDMNTKSFNRKTWLGAMFTFALVAVLGLTFAFKPFSKAKESEKRASYTFEYTGTSYSQPEVQDLNNWSYTSNNDLCAGMAEVPCRIQVSEDYVNESGSEPKLKPNINISAAKSAAHESYFVNTIADATGVISNRPI
ncbi:hypothetical protein [Pedobacter antarcticus]|uniref:hypothetical protein n=1 Tax=Pedobacter antarcticus TaxID=34086 RepID=UPI00292D2C6D|nr:hypothetical protein [Pedobacter antarcticus]